jgi:hypothetical protein
VFAARLPEASGTKIEENHITVIADLIRNPALTGLKGEYWIADQVR